MHRPALIRRLAWSTAAFALVGSVATPGQAADCTWTGGVGDWSSATMWSCGTVPGAGDAVRIDARPSIASLVNVTSNQNAGTLTLDGGDTIAINNAGLGIYGGSLANAGLIAIANSGALVGYGATTMITGSGTITLDNMTGSARLFGSGTNQLAIGSGQTIGGAGEVGIDQGAITNAGIVTANLAGRQLTLDARGGSGGLGDGTGVGTNNAAGFFNTGTLSATNGGTLFVGGGVYENGAGGTIQAVGAGSTVALGSDSRVVGGTLTSSGGGRITATNVEQYLNDVTLGSGSTLAVVNDYLHLSNGFTNNGTVNLGVNSDLRGDTAVTTIGGSGAIVLDNSQGSARVFGQGASQLVVGSGQTTSGAGQIGIDQGAITNTGIINANVAGGQITLDARAGNGGSSDGTGVGAGGVAGFLNANLLEATGGGTLFFNSGQYLNTGAVIQAVGTGSVVSLGGDSRIVGGTLTSSGGGQIAALNTVQYANDVTLSAGSTLNVTNDYLYLNNGFTNNGTVNLSANSDLRGESAGTTIGGTGSVVLDNSQGSARVFGLGANQIVIGSAQTITGSGEIGIDQGAITNNGIINANVTGRQITLDARAGNGGSSDGTGVGAGGVAGFLNTNLLEATGGGTLFFNSGQYLNTGATIQAVGAGSVVSLGGDSRIVGGTLASSGGGRIAALNTVQYANDVTLSAGSTLNVTNDYLYLNNSFTNNGTVNVAVNSDLRGESAVTTIGGAGSIVLDNSQGSARVFGLGANQIVIGSAQTITGSGEIGIDQGAITNNGIINANVTGRQITLDARGGNGGNGDGSGVGAGGVAGFLNANLLKATDGGTLFFNSGQYLNTGAVIQALGTGSVVSLGNDSRIVGGTLTSSGGGQIAALNVQQYLNDVTLSAGSALNVTNDYLYLNNSFTNNGTVNVAANSDLRGESAVTTIGGTGAIVLDNSQGSARVFGLGANQLVIDNGQTVRGSGAIGIDQGAITNRGTILADGAITIDARGGGGGNSDMTGVGTGNLAGFYNAGGTIGTSGAGTLTLVGGLYQNSAAGTFQAGPGGLVNMANDSNLTNLQAGGVLNQGNYTSLAGGTVNLRSDQTGSIVTIGTGHAGIDTVVTLSGAGSVLEVTPRGDGTTTTIDQSLQGIAQSGELILSNGRSFTAPGGGFTNAGTLALTSGASFAASGLANSGLATGNGTLAAPITNSGSVVASGGTLNSQAITGSAGTIQSNTGATLSLDGATGLSTAGFLVNNGALALGGNDVTVTGDYQNAGFGVGSAFNARANVTGSGLILAASATQDLSGPGLTGSTLNVGNVRLGGSSSTTLTITNNGTLTTLRGAVESPASNTVNISSSNFVVGPNGGNTTVTLSYTGTQAGSLGGQTITVANNFDNVADQTLQITGAAYNPAAASLSPNPIDLGATRTGGTLSGTVTISNIAPAGIYSESLAVTGTSGAGGASGTAPSGLIAAGASAASTVMLNTAASGTKSGTVTYALATDGTGTSGLAQAALPSQSVTVNGRVYQVADPQLASTNVTFATVRQGSTAPTASLGVTNAANGALTDSLQTRIASTPAGVTATAPGSLAGGQSGTVSFVENTATAGVFTGTAQLGFTSTDPELAPLALPAQSVTVGGTVTQLAVAQILKNAGMGSFSGSGTTYTLDFGTIAAGSGSVSADLAVLNAIMNTAYGEKLGGTFGSSGGTGYTFNGMTFNGLAGGSEDTGNLLTFNYAGLGDGVYNDLLTFDGFSSFTGLSDMGLGPIRVNVTAQIAGAGGGPTGAVPEPASWAMLVLGIGALGASLRRRRPAAMAATVTAPAGVTA